MATSKRNRCIVTGEWAHDLHHIRVPGDGVGRKPPDSRGIHITRSMHTLIHNGGMTLQEQAIYRIISDVPAKRHLIGWLASFIDKGDAVRMLKDEYGG